MTDKKKHPSKAETAYKQMTVQIPLSVHRGLKIRAAEEGRTFKGLVEELLKEYLVKEKQS